MNAKLMTVSVLAMAALCGRDPARSQDMQPVQIVQAPQGITAVGHSEMKVKPDVARVTLTVTADNKNSADAVQQNAQRSAAVLSALQGVGMDVKDIQTQSYTVQPQYDYSQSPAKRKGYEVQNSLEVTVHDLTKVGLVIDSATAGGVSEIGGVTFDLSDPSQAQSQALAQAVTAAKRKASAMASAAGVDLGRLLTITEGAAADTTPPLPEFAPRAMNAAAAAPQTTINPQQITIDADATLVYAMGAAR